MAMTKQQRKEKLEENKILQSFSKISEEVDTSSIAKGSITDLHTLEEFLKDKELAYLGESENQSVMDQDLDVLVSIFFMSTKNVKVSDAENFLSLGYSFNKGYSNNEDRYYIGDSTNTTLEKFIELPKVSQSENSLTTKAIVKLCDADNIYNLYQDKALSIMRKLFAHPYHMFTGSNLYKVRDTKDGVTLYVMYDKIRKKFRYAYNPKFILECAIDEWMLQSKRYKSLEDCYCYLLSFMITHEMLHIIHHNTVSNGKGVQDLIDSGDHDVANQVQDSFINCKIARRYIGADGIKNTGTKSIAPIPRIGIGSKITVRAEHNNGLKQFNDTEELAKLIYNILSESLTISREGITLKNKSYSTGVNISNLAGADVFITVDVNPTFSPLRSNGSNVFQRVVNDIIKAITDGKVHGKFTKISNAEKASDLDTLPVGQIVLVKGVRDICYIESYNEDTKLYNLTKSEITGVTRKPLPDGTTLCTPVYDNTGKTYGTRTRIQIKPYNPDDDSYIEAPQVKRDRLTPEELKQAKQLKQDENQGAPVPPMPPQQEDKPVKSFNVGDIVWVRKLKKFGRITLAQDGKFELEEVIEKPAKVIDDSNNYN